MVMDAQPTPQSVGREFVRQYYTLLNKAPNHLHRFYNNQSSFIHGGLDSHNREATLVVGQKNIHNKIQQLNFRDCHAKISQVDAQATLGNGVVVQVTGELSNDGQPMRRFTQTFVLAAQSPKNYYVHNDIFRYQDLYADEENDGEARSENGDEQEQEVKIIDNNQNNNQIPAPQQIYYSIPAVAHAVGPAVPIVPAFTAQPPQVNGVVHEELLQAMPQPSQQAQILPPPAAVVSPQQPPQQITLQPPQIAALITGPLVAQPSTQNSAILNQPPTNILPSPLDSVIVNQDNIAVLQKHAQTQLPQPTNAIQNNFQNEITANEILVQQQPTQQQIQPEVQEAEKPKKEEYISKQSVATEQIEKHEQPIVVRHPQPHQNEPKTYATLLKSINSSSNIGSGFVPLPPPSHQQNSVQVQQTTISIKSQDYRSDNAPPPALPQRNNATRQNKERRTSNTFGDSNQLFFGNVPHHATEDELKHLFGKFGAVVDLRIHSKSVSKITGVRLPPNYGFITYEDPESVQNCLANCPLYFPDNSPDGQKLNVEEKKTRLRPTNELPPRMANNLNNNGGPGSGGLGNNSQRSSGGGNNSGQSRSLSNSGGGMLRGNSGNGGNVGGGPVRGTSGGSRPSGGFGRNDRGGPGGPPPRNSGNGTSNSGGGTYNRR